jgi:uncharacterized membrane protein YdjX (TVP38/TMEM64 family)
MFEKGVVVAMVGLLIGCSLAFLVARFVASRFLDSTLQRWEYFKVCERSRDVVWVSGV